MALSGLFFGEQLHAALREMLNQTDVDTKRRDFEHLLFDSSKSETILHFADLLH